MQRTGAVCQKAAAPLKAIGVTVSEESIRAYLEDLNHRGRREETVRFYAAKLKTFYDYLPPDKQIVLNTLETWRQALLAEGYAPATVNTNISAANGLLDYLGRRDLQLTGQLETETAPQSELTRTEYLRLLSAARALEKERTYLLVKAIALTGAHVGELPQITVEAVQSGRTPAVSGGEQRRVQLPRCLQAELLSYCRRQGLTAGPVFVTRSRRPLRRTQVTGDIQSLSGAARVAPEKCNPRCLRKLYLVTQAEIDRGVLTEEEVVALLTKNAPDYPEQIRRIVHDSHELVTVYPYAADWVRDLKKKGYKVYILSNFSEFGFNRVKDTFDFLPYADGALISYEVKLVKPDRKIYETLCERFDITPENAVFLDDNAKNTEAAREFGLHAITVENKEQTDRDLHALGVTW